MKVIQSNNIYDAWDEARDLVMTNGRDIEDDGELLVELINLFIIITDPDPTLGDDAMRLDATMLKWMHDNFTKIKKINKLGNSWSYGWRLYHYMDGLDQIDYIKKKLERKPNTKSATISMLIKPGVEPYVPCVSLLDFKIRDDTLTLTATCRSIDIGKKGIYNMIELSRILTDLAGDLSIPDTRLIMHVISAHIYKKDSDKT